MTFGAVGGTGNQPAEGRPNEIHQFMKPISSKRRQHAMWASCWCGPSLRLQGEQLIVTHKQRWWKR